MHVQAASPRSSPVNAPLKGVIHRGLLLKSVHG